jgi:hypothetical protein
MTWWRAISSRHYPAEAIAALAAPLSAGAIPAVVFASVTDAVSFAWDFEGKYPYRVYAVSPGHKVG